jgi:hypothetical protein
MLKGQRQRRLQIGDFPFQIPHGLPHGLELFNSLFDPSGAD